MNEKPVERSEAGEAWRRVRKKEEIGPGKVTSHRKIEECAKRSSSGGSRREVVAGRLEAAVTRKTFGEDSRNGERSRRKDEIRETNDCTVTRSVFKQSGENKGTQAKKEIDGENGNTERAGRRCISER